MTPLTYSDFIGEYPEFTSVAQAAVERRLLTTSNYLSEDAWGAFWLEAAFLFTAHKLALRFNISAAVFAAGMRSANSSIKTVTSQSASPDTLSESSVVSELVTSSDPFKADLARTSYGLEFLALMNTVISPANVVVSPRIGGY